MRTVEASEAWLANTAAVTPTLSRLRAHRVAVASSTLVCWVGSQWVSEVTCFALVTVDSRCVVDAFQTSACQLVTVPRSTRVHIVVALTPLTRPHWATFPKGVPKEAICTELTAGTCDPRGAVVAHHLLCLRHHGTAEAIVAGTRLAAAGVVRVVIETNGAVGTLNVRILVP